MFFKSPASQMFLLKNTSVMSNVSLLNVQRKSNISMSQFVLSFIKHQSLQLKSQRSQHELKHFSSNSPKLWCLHSIYSITLNTYCMSAIDLCMCFYSYKLILGETTKTKLIKHKRDLR